MSSSSTHNHPPRCCCDPTCAATLAGDRCAEHTCPGCPEHGLLASKPAGITCPQCHAQIGQPHTDYCTLAPGRVWDGVLPRVVDWQ